MSGTHSTQESGALPATEGGGESRGRARAVLEGVAAGRLQPRVDRVFALAEAGEAHAYIEARRNVGKVLLRVDPPAAAQSPPAAGTAPAAT